LEVVGTGGGGLKQFSIRDLLFVVAIIALVLGGGSIGGRHRLDFKS
jgi:hypothetical protein